MPNRVDYSVEMQFIRTSNDSRGVLEAFERRRQACPGESVLPRRRQACPGESVLPGSEWKTRRDGGDETSSRTARREEWESEPFRLPPAEAQDAAPPSARLGTLLLGGEGATSAEVTACLCRDGVGAELSLVCRPGAHGRVRLSGWARPGGAGPDAPVSPADFSGGQGFGFELAPGETRHCTLRVRQGDPAAGEVEVRLRVGNAVLGGDPAASIAARAAALGLTGAAVSGCEAVPGGHRVRYRHADVYFSATGGAHGLHGAVRDKYGDLGGPGGVLGLPLSGVWPTPDGQGQHAHFAGGSVYWHPTTGAAALRGGLRDLWHAAGAERGPLGYPTSDELSSGGPPGRRYVTFQNGVLLAPETGPPAPALAGLGAEGVRAALDRAVRRSGGGLRLGTALVGVSPTHPDLRRSGGRVLTFRLSGGAGVGGAGVGGPGMPEYGAELPLLFEAAPSPDSPGRTRLRARLFGAALFHAGGPDPQRTLGQLRAGVAALFGQPATLFEVPETAGFLALTVLPDGALQLAFRPDVLGRLAAQAAQGQLDDLQF